MTTEVALPASSRSTAISERFARVALTIERYVLPWIFVWLTYLQLDYVRASYLNYHALLRTGLPHLTAPLFWASMTKSILIAAFSMFMTFTLLFNRRPTHLPRTLIQITVPLAMSYYLFLYTAVPVMPLELREDLMPIAWHVPAAIMATLLSIIGYAISFWGLFRLGRSFAILVAVRRIVTAGPYAYVRHPMYLGNLFDLAGLVLASLSLGMLLLAAGFVLLTVTRARLEEERLLEADPAYREYMQHTGFLFPRLTK